MSAGDYSIGSRNWPGLAKLAEECGEAIQAAAKIIAAGGEDTHWDGTASLRAQLEDEIGDVRAAIAFLTWASSLDDNRILGREAVKEQLFRQWHTAELDLTEGPRT